ncbi:hypothetical protein N0V88_001927 [Collariella sp. IMI 366227]|nr:hypothetical protein N0V88_001927 [Collariella sp. IMI 366227]
MGSIIPARATVPFLVAMMLLTGVCNTLLTKYQDNQCVRDCANPDLTKRRHFEQPVIQTLQMFIGEMGCWLVAGLRMLYNRYVSSTTTAYQPIHTTDDDGTAPDDASICSTTPSTAPPLPPQNASVTRGWRVTIFALPAICDILGTTLMNAGLLLVAASIYQMTRGALVLFVGLFSVVFIKRHLHLFQWLTEAGRYGPFDMVEGWRQFWEHQAVFVSSILIMISIGGFNFFGFKWLQVIGFAMLVYFTFLFNGLVQPPLKFLRVEEVEELLPEEPIEHN